MKYFIYDSKMGRSINSDEAQLILLPQALAVFSQLEFDTDSFFGLIRNDGSVLQFTGENDGKTLLVDMPVATKNGSFQLRTVREAGQEMIQEFFEGESLEKTHQFEFHKW